MNQKQKGKEHRRKLGFTSKSKCSDFFKAKDIIHIDWVKIDEYNQRLIDIGQRIQNVLIVKNDMDVIKFVNETFKVIKENEIIESFTNHGRARELVYYSWMLGYLIETLFVPFIQKELNLQSIVRNGGDDLTNPETFERVSSSDLIDPTKNISIDVQCGVGDGKVTIKKSKVDYVIKNQYNGYVFTVGLGTGLYAIINLNELQNAEFVPNSSWEGALCWTAPDNIFKSWSN